MPDPDVLRILEQHQEQMFAMWKEADAFACKLCTDYQIAFHKYLQAKVEAEHNDGPDD